MEIINPYCALIAPAAFICDAPLVSNQITALVLRIAFFFKFRRVLYGVTLVSVLIWRTGLDRWGYVCLSLGLQAS